MELFIMKQNVFVFTNKNAYTPNDYTADKKV